MKYVICKNCNWVAFEVTRAYAEDEVKRFNKFYEALPKKGKLSYGGRPSSIKLYEVCFLCNGSYTNFRKAKKSELPMGSTLQPVIRKQD